MRKLFLLLTMIVFAGSQLLWAQTKTITGTITGKDDGMPLPGVSIVVKGTTTGTVTDGSGKYSLTIPSDATTLVVSFIGMKTQEVGIQGRNVINVELVGESIGLEEVIAVAYGTAKKSSFTGSASVVKSDQLQKVQNASVSKALEGAAAGVQVTSSSGQPGSNASIRIRGIGSIYASSSPLYVVDGVAFEGNISTISQQDIESITVLKDAAANSLYGSRGANGVILITTKKGTSGEAKVTLEAKWGVNKRAYKDYDVIESSSDYYEMAWESLRNDYYFNIGQNWLASGKSASSNLISKLGGYNSYDVNGDNKIDAADHALLINPLTGRINPNAKLMYQDDWKDKMFSTGVRSDYQTSISGGDSKMNYYFSMGYLNDEGYIVNSDYERYNARLKVESQLKSFLKVGANMGFTREDKNWIEQSGTQGNNMFYIANFMAPIYPVYLRDEQGKVKYDEKGQVIYDFGDGVSKRPVSSMSNPIAAQALDLNEYNTNIFNGKAFAELSFLKDFKLNVNLALDNSDQINHGYLNGIYGQFKDDDGIASKTIHRSTAVTGQQLLTWNRDFGMHGFDVLLGHESYNRKYNYVYAKKQKFLDPENIELDGAIINPSASSYATEYSQEGFLSRLQYDYDDRYYLSGSYRRDGSSKFHKDNRWGDFWSVGGSWRISKESFLMDQSWIDDLKLKVSYGTQGNDALTGMLPWADNYVVAPNGTDIALKFNYKGNKKICWEKNASFNVGTEFSFWESRLKGGIEYFLRDTKDMLMYRPLAISTGITSYPDNIGDIRNKGVEIELSGDVIRTNDLVWNISFNATHFKNEITKLPEERKEAGIPSGLFLMKEGKSVYDYYMRKYAGVNENGLPLYFKDVKDESGAIKEVTTTTNWSEGTEYYLDESALPLFYGGVNTTVSYKGFDLSAQMSYQIGGKGYDYVYASLMSSGATLGNNWHKDMMNRWTPDNTKTDVPRLQSSFSDMDRTSDRFLTDASYFNVKNITLGYTLPSSLTRKVSLQTVRFFVSGDNLALFSKRQGYDPRGSFTASGDFGVYSAIRTISGGVSVKF